MTKSLSTFEQRLVSEILQLAEIKFQQQYEINPKAAYNILKVLSAYNEVLPRHGISPTQQTRLYNYLLHLSKKHDPQCKEEWRLLIDTHRTLSNFDSQVEKSRIDRSQVEKSSSKSNISVSKSFTKSPVEKSRVTKRALDQEISQFNNLSNKQLVSAQISNIGTQPVVHSNQMLKYYRERSRSSFDNKENQMNRINASHSVLDINKTTASQRHIKMEQSGHFGGPISKTLILEEDDEELRMNQRATTAYKINMFTKAFLILKATCLIHDEARNRLRKILKFSRLREVQKYFRIFNSGIQSCKTERLKMQSAIQLHRKHIMNKVLNLLKILKRLEIRQEDTERLQNNPLAIDFVLTLATQTINKEAELRERFEYFEQNGKYQQLSLMFKVFGRVQPQNQSTLLKLLRKRKLISIKKLFLSWKNTANSRKATIMSIKQRNIKKQIMRVLKENVKLRRQCNKRVTKYQSNNKFKKMQLLFNSFRQFSKFSRNESLKVQQIQQLVAYNQMQHYMSFWTHAIRQKKTEILKIKKQKMNLEQSYEKQIKNYVFYQGLVKYGEWRRHKRTIMAKAMVFKNAKIIEKTWKILISRVLTKKKMLYLHEKTNEIGRLKPIVINWRKLTAIHKIRHIIYKVGNRMVLEMLDDQVESKKIADQYRMKFVKSVFSTWKRQATEQKKQIEMKIRRIQQFQNRRKQQFFVVLRQKHDKIVPLRNMTLLVKTPKHAVTQVFPKFSRSVSFFKKLKMHYTRKMDAKVRKNKISSVRQGIIKKCLRKMLDRHNFKNKVKDLVHKIHKAAKISTIIRVKQIKTQRCLKASHTSLLNQLKNRVKHRHFHKFIAILRSFLKKSSQKYKIAQKHFNRKLQQTTFLLMRSVFIVKMERKVTHHSIIRQIHHMIKTNAIKRIKIGCKFLQFHAAMDKLTAKRISILMKHNTIKKMKEYAAHSQRSHQNYLKTKRLTITLFRRRLKSRRIADLRQKTLQKYINFNRFIKSVYIYLEDRKTIQLVMHHAAHQVMKKAFLSWLLSQENPNSTIESQNRLPIYDMINYYKHK